MFTHGIEGYLVSPGDTTKAVEYMETLFCDPALRFRMGQLGRRRFDACFDVQIMVK